MNCSFSSHMVKIFSAISKYMLLSYVHLQQKQQKNSKHKECCSQCVVF